MKRLLLIGLLFSATSAFSADPPNDDEPVYDGKPLSRWVKQLTHKDIGLRREAAVALSKLGYEARPAYPALANALNEDDADLLVLVMDAMDVVKTRIDDSVPTLRKLLTHREAKVRSRAAHSLGNQWDQPDATVLEPAAADMMALLKTEKEPTVRREMVRTLGAIREDFSVPALIATLRDGSAEVRADAADALDGFGPRAKQSVAPLVDTMLADHDSKVRCRAAYALGSYFYDGATTVPALKKAIKDRSGEVRAGAAFALGKAGKAAAGAVPNLIVALKDDDASVRRLAASALAYIGPDSVGAVGALVESLKDEELQVRCNAAEALGMIGPQAKASVSALIHALGDKSIELRSSAAEALGRIGPGAKEAIPALLESLKDYSYTQFNGALAISLIGPDPNTVVPVLIKMFEDDSPNPPKARCAAGIALGHLGPKAKAAVPVLHKMLKDKLALQDLRSTAAFALGEIGADSAVAVPAFIEVLEGRVQYYYTFRSAAAIALGKIGPVAKAAIPALKKVENEKVHDLSEAATEAIKLIDRDK